MALLLYYIIITISFTVEAKYGFLARFLDVLHLY